MSTVSATRLPASSNPLVSAVRAWNRFWFQPADPTQLGLIRIFVGLFTLYVHLAYTVDLQEFFGPHAWMDAAESTEFRTHRPTVGIPFDWSNPQVNTPRTPDEADFLQKFGVLPRPLPQTQEEWTYFERYQVHPKQTLRQGYQTFSIWFHVSDSTGMALVHAGILVIMFCFMIGFCTRVTSVLTWLAAVSYVDRSPVTLFGMDTMMNLQLVYLMVGPSGAALSVDRLIARYWKTWRALRAREPVPDLTVAPRASANLAIRLLQVNLCFVYLISGMSKLQGAAWWNGTAVWGTLANPEFSPIYFESFLAFLRFLSRHRPLWEAAMAGATLMTLVMEIGFPFLVWNRSLRWPFLVLGLMLHTGIAVFMGLNMFSLFMLSFLLAFVPPETIRWLLAWPARRATHFSLAFDSRARAQVRAVSLVRSVDVWDQVELTPAGAEVSRTQLIAPDGEIWTGYPLFQRVLRSLRLLQPAALLTWIPGFAQAGNTWFPGEHERHAALVGAGHQKQDARSERVPS